MTVYGAGSTLQEVWFGEYWEAFQDGKTYIVWGSSGKPVIPQFHTYATAKNNRIKFDITITSDADKERDVRH